jgi:hypothetical protein
MQKYRLVILTLWGHSSMSSVRLVLMGALLLPGATMLRAQANLPDVPEANPARPTVSTPATLTPVGYLQFENGINQVYKLTLDKRVELLTRGDGRPGKSGIALGRGDSASEASRTPRMARTCVAPPQGGHVTTMNWKGNCSPPVSELVSGNLPQNHSWGNIRRKHNEGLPNGPRKRKAGITGTLATHCWQFEGFGEGQAMADVWTEEAFGKDLQK